MNTILNEPGIINWNDEVTVNLTDDGLKVAIDHPLAKERLIDATTSWQFTGPLWEVAHIFGPHLYNMSMGGKRLFTGLLIQRCPCDLEDQLQCNRLQLET